MRLNKLFIPVLAVASAGIIVLSGCAGSSSGVIAVFNIFSNQVTNGGSINAPQGTQVQIQFQSNQPVSNWSATQTSGANINVQINQSGFLTAAPPAVGQTAGVLVQATSAQGQIATFNFTIVGTPGGLLDTRIDQGGFSPIFARNTSGIVAAGSTFTYEVNGTMGTGTAVAAADLNANQQVLVINSGAAGLLGNNGAFIGGSGAVRITNNVENANWNTVPRNTIPVLLNVFLLPNGQFNVPVAFPLIGGNPTFYRVVVDGQFVINGNPDLNINNGFDFRFVTLGYNSGAIPGGFAVVSSLPININGPVPGNGETLNPNSFFVDCANINTLGNFGMALPAHSAMLRVQLNGMNFIEKTVPVPAAGVDNGRYQFRDLQGPFSTIPAVGVQEIVFS
ncbi:MAG: hypothetical protein ACK4P3_02720, partial [Fimbriimonadaceae bacterium]